MKLKVGREASFVAPSLLKNEINCWVLCACGVDWSSVIRTTNPSLTISARVVGLFSKSLMFQVM